MLVTVVLALSVNSFLMGMLYAERREAKKRRAIDKNMREFLKLAMIPTDVEIKERDVN